MDEAQSKMDLEYWIDYLAEFGVEMKIPLYDHMSFIRYHNLEVWALVAFGMYLAYKSTCFCCGLCCCKSKKEDAQVDSDKKTN